MAIGIGLYFAVPVEPHGTLLWCAGLFSLFCMWIARGREADTAALILGVALICAGFSIGGARAHSVSGPVLGWRFYGPIEGHVIKIDRSASDAVRLTLSDVRLADLSPDQTPKRVRVALHGAEIGVTPEPGMSIGLTGHLSPPSGPVEPGGFDFQRHAWFQKIGAIGYTRSPVVQVMPRASDGGIYGLRMRLSQHIQARMPDDVAGVAAAITTGDRSAIPKPTTEALRGANLAHLLAISGLHMGLLAGFVFASVRLGIALFPYIALRINGKKVAACVALVASSGYLLLSGSSVSTERAFVMTSVVLIAVLLDRRALTLRAVAIAAVIVLLLRPEALMGPGFQMSFAATAALVGVFGWLRDHQVPLGPRWLRPLSAVVVSSFVAGLATAPFAAMHFNHVAHYGLLANVVSVPVMGTLVMPSAVVAAVLAPVGLEWIPLWVMEQGLRWIVTVAEFVSALDGARGGVKRGGPWVLPLIAMGGVTLLLWQGRARWLGAAMMCAAMLVWRAEDRPMVLVSDTGGLVGVVTPDGRALSKAKGQGFIARNWLENDGSMATQERAAQLWFGAMKTASFGAVIHVSGKRALSAFAGCKIGYLVVFSMPYEAELPCEVIDADDLKATGALAIYKTNEGTSTKTARAMAGRRLWNDGEIRAR
ncbi:ComEC/Rec2 family competence protein [Shimia sp.]|uniref:ComEC/Rec2 family competence protein n=1 Tax=Shimia sp. TaxID=1954381 RepID=UPI003BA8C7F4